MAQAPSAVYAVRPMHSKPARASPSLGTPPIDEQSEPAQEEPQCPPLKGVARSAGGWKASHAKVLRCRPYPVSFRPRVIPSAARNLIAPLALGSTPHTTPRVILSEAKNPASRSERIPVAILHTLPGEKALHGWFNTGFSGVVRCVYA